MRETDGTLLRAIDMENIVRWGKTTDGGIFTFSFTEDLGATEKKVRMRTADPRAIFQACNAHAKSAMSHIARQAGGPSSEGEMDHALVSQI